MTKEEFYKGGNEQVERYLGYYKIEDKLISQTRYVINKKYLLSDMLLDFANDEFKRRLKQELNNCLNEALSNKKLRKNPHSNNIGEFVMYWLEKYDYD